MTDTNQNQTTIEEARAIADPKRLLDLRKLARLDRQNEELEGQVAALGITVARLTRENEKQSRELDDAVERSEVLSLQVSAFGKRERAIASVEASLRDEIGKRDDRIAELTNENTRLEVELAKMKARRAAAGKPKPPAKTPSKVKGK